MKCIVAANQFPVGPGGLASYMRLLEHELVLGGNQVEFLALNTPDTTSEFYRGSSQYTQIDSPTLRALTGALGSRLASRRYLHRLLEMSIWTSAKRSLSRRMITQPDVIHYVGTGWSRFGFALLRLARKLNVCFTVWPAVHPGDWGDDLLDVYLYNRADKVFCATNFELKHLRSLGGSLERLTVCGLPAMCLRDGDGKVFRQNWTLGDRPIVLFIGRRDRGKGYHALLDAWQIVHAQRPAAVLVVAGPGDGVTGEQRMLADSGILDLGIPNERCKADALAACDLFCLPSQHESFGIVYVEAWTYGKAVICGTAPASRELVQHEVNGLHASQEVPELVSTILKLLDCPEMARSLGQSGFQTQQEHFSTRTMTDAHLHVWREAVGMFSGTGK